MNRVQGRGLSSTYQNPWRLSNRTCFTQSTVDRLSGCSWRLGSAPHSAPALHPCLQALPARAWRGGQAGSSSFESGETSPQVDVQDGPAEAALDAGQASTSGNLESSDCNFTAQNAKDRSVSWKWLQSDPLSHLILIGIAMHPLEVLKKELLVVSGQNWELQQRAKTARSQVEKKADSRAYRLTLAADEVLDKDFVANLKRIFTTPGVWACMPESSLTVGFRAKSFRVLSKLGAAVHQTARHPHQQYPVKLYRLMHQPSESADMVAEPPRRKDWVDAEVTGKVPHTCRERSSNPFSNFMRLCRCWTLLALKVGMPVCAGKWLPNLYTHADRPLPRLQQYGSCRTTELHDLESRRDASRMAGRR